MPFLLPQLRSLAANYDGSTPLPRKLERIARLVADDEWTQVAIARACRVSPDSIQRLNRQPAFAARVQRLRQLAAERAMREEPLAYLGNRVALLGQEVRALRDQLHTSNYTAVLGVSKQGNAIVGFDSARVSAIIRAVTAIDSMTSPKSTIADSTKVDVSVTMTTADAVTRVQALLSRAAPADPAPPGTGGVQGGMFRNDTDAIEASGPVQGPQQVLEAKAVEVEE